MKTLRRRPIAGSKTPWEQLCGDGFTSSAHGFVLIIDREGRQVTAPPQWHDRCRLWADWQEGMRWRDTVPQPGAQRAWQQWATLFDRAVTSGDAWQTSLVFRTSGAPPLRVDCVCQPLRDGGSHRIGAIIAGKFRARARASSGPVGLPPKVTTVRPAPESAALYVAPKRKAGESGFVLERKSTKAGELLGPTASEVGASFPECLPGGLRRTCTALLGRTDASVATTAMSGLSADDAADYEVIMLPMGDAQHCVVVRRDGIQEAVRRMLLSSAEQILSLEGELRRAQRLATQGMVAAGIGHELTNSLAIALAHVSLFTERHARDKDATVSLTPAIHALQTAGTICHRFREWGTTAVATAALDLPAAVRQEFETMSRIVPREMTFRSEVPGPLWVKADHTQIAQMVLNLVLNARDATKPDGHIALTVGQTPPAGTDSAWHWIEVEDDGVGIPPDLRDKVFTAYFTTKPRTLGTGLGLASVMHITNTLGGKVTLASEVNRGTRIRILLPRARKTNSAHG